MGGVYHGSAPAERPARGSGPMLAPQVGGVKLQEARAESGPLAFGN